MSTWEWSGKQTRSPMDVILLLYLSTIFQSHQERPLQLLLLQIHQSLWNKENFHLKLKKKLFSSIIQFTLESFGDGESIFFNSFSFFCLFCFYSFSTNSTLFCSTRSAQLELHKHLWRKDIAHEKQFGTLIHAAYWIFVIHFFSSYHKSPGILHIFL